jgi:hypothetical protein
MLTSCLIAPGDLAILMAGTGTTSVTSPARSSAWVL